MLDLEKKRAEFALTAVRTLSPGELDKAKTAVEKMPPLIHHNGLIAALAYARGKEDMMKTQELTCEWLRSRRLIEQSGDELDALIRTDNFRLMHITDEALAFLGWMKRIVKANLG